MEKQFYTRQEAAELLNVDPQTISNLGNRGIIKLTKNNKWAVMVDKQDLDNYIDSIRPTIRDFLEVEQLRKDISKELAAARREHKAILHTRELLGVFEWTQFRFLLHSILQFIRFGMPMKERYAVAIEGFLSGETSDMVAADMEVTRSSVSHWFNLGVNQICKYLENIGKIAAADREHVETIKIQNEEIKTLKEEVHNLKLKLGCKDALKKKMDTEEGMRLKALLSQKIFDYNLSVRCLNCLKAADIETVGDLVRCSKRDLMHFRNFGKKSLNELDDFVDELGLTFGMDIQF